MVSFSSPTAAPPRTRDPLPAGHLVRSPLHVQKILRLEPPLHGVQFGTERAFSGGLFLRAPHQGLFQGVKNKVPEYQE